MSKRHDKELEEIILSEFSEETTEEEAIEFLMHNPNIDWIPVTLIGYKMCRLFGMSPRKAMLVSIQSYIGTLEENNEH